MVSRAVIIREAQMVSRAAIIREIQMADRAVIIRKLQMDPEMVTVRVAQMVIISRDIMRSRMAAKRAAKEKRRKNTEN